MFAPPRPVAASPAPAATAPPFRNSRLLGLISSCSSRGSSSWGMANSCYWLHFCNDSYGSILLSAPGRDCLRPYCLPLTLHYKRFPTPEIAPTRHDRAGQRLLFPPKADVKMSDLDSVRMAAFGQKRTFTSHNPVSSSRNSGLSKSGSPRVCAFQSSRVSRPPLAPGVLGNTQPGISRSQSPTARRRRIWNSRSTRARRRSPTPVSLPQS